MVWARLRLLRKVRVGAVLNPTVPSRHPRFDPGHSTVHHKADLPTAILLCRPACALLCVTSAEPISSEEMHSPWGARVREVPLFVGLAPQLALAEPPPQRSR